MRPYYQDKNSTIYHGDCREVLPSLSLVDLVVTDPPYGINYQSNYRKEKFDLIANDNDALSLGGYIESAWRVLRPHRHIYLFGGYDLSNHRFHGITELVWDKATTGLGNLESPWGVSHEKLTFGIRSDTVKTPAHRGQSAARMRRGSVLRFTRVNSGAMIHPTEKPILLLRELIESSSHIGELVLDPFMGSGSTLLASLIEGRHAIGIEIEESYCEVAAKRLAQGALPFTVNG